MNVSVIGAGPAGLMAANVLVDGGARVTIYDRMPSVGRKFLLAGRGGLNLTHSEPLDIFMTRYTGAMQHLRKSIVEFPPDALRAWSESLGQPTFVGSSGRVFPQSFKTSPLLREWLRCLDRQGARFALRHHWTGWNDDGDLTFETSDGMLSVKADATVIALGGASWPKLGSDGKWLNILQQKNIAIVPLRSANCGFTLAWSELFRSKFEGHPLKGIMLNFETHAVRGDAIVTQYGLEGGAVYALSAPLREAIRKSGQAELKIALRPDLDNAELSRRLDVPRQKQSLSNFLRKAVGLSPVAIGLLYETAIMSGLNLAALNSDKLAAFINSIPLRLDSVAPLERAISTAGGISFDEIDEDFMLRKLPGVFAAGEMLDWEAPTGGYLLQASFATGAAAGRGVLNYLKC